MDRPSPENSPDDAPRAQVEKAPWYLWPNLLSLDAPVVAVVWLWCFSVDWQIPPNPILQPMFLALTLGAAVWLIYTADRLLDARRIKDWALSTPRHRFAKRYSVPLLIVWVAVLGLAFWMATSKIPVIFFSEGIRIALLVVFYFVIRLMKNSDLQIILPKEVCCGFIFAIGSTFPVFVIEGDLGSDIWTGEFLLFGLLCVLNCVVISIWEWREDAANDSGAVLVRVIPSLRVNYVKYSFVIAVVAAWLGSRGMSPVLFSVALSAALIGAIGLVEGALSKNLRRALADAALLTPLVVVPLLG